MPTLRQHRILHRLRLPGCLLAGVLCLWAFTLSPEGYVGVSDPPLQPGSPVWICYALLLGGLFWLAAPHARRVTPGMAAFGLLFGVVNYAATTLFAYDSWAFLKGAAIAGAAVRILLQSLTMAAAFALLDAWLTHPIRRAARGSRPEGTPTQATLSETPLPPHAALATMPLPDTRADVPPHEVSDTTLSHKAITGMPSHKANPAPTATKEGSAPRASANPVGAWFLRKANRAASAAGARWPRLAGWVRRHPVAAAMLVMLVGWSPYLIAFFPGTVIWDMGEMIGQLYGLRELSTWHPILTTWLFGGCVWLGRLAGSDNLGTFLFTALQTAALAYALADSLRLMARLGVRRRWRLLTLCFFAFTPIFAGFAQAVGKDTLYTAVLLLTASRLVAALRFGRLTHRENAGLFLWAVLACLVRSNGLYVVLGTAALVVPFGLRGRERLRTGGALAGALAVALAFSGVLIPALGIKDTTASGLYSVPFQQSARVLRDHAATVTPAQYAEIDRVLDAAALPALYEPTISDPVKYTFRQYGQGRAAEVAALARYRSTWLAMARAYPLPYLEAFVAGNTGYYSFTPKIDAARTYHYQGGIRFVFETYALGDDPRYLHTAQAAWLQAPRTLLAAYARGWRRVPLLEVALYCATYVWSLVGAGLTLRRRRGWRELLAFLPALLSLGVCLLSPVNDYFRYFLPVVAMWPLLLALAGTGEAGA
ncbi:MAG: DUF6020 family protein [Candidatus Limiplasma sp.]|nr:DUF6020 family protein [Candidatus Limiplasma sp.]MEA5146745.1 DUF6020 family protein [Candidatus Limiplasma sp.]